jgi:hypothetical protein
MSSLSIAGTLPRRAQGARARRAALPFGRLAAFSTLAMPIAAAQAPIGVYLPALYAQYLGSRFRRSA